MVARAESRPIFIGSPKPSNVAAVLVDDSRAAQASIQILLGIDFGTAYTKAVWREYGGGRSGVAAIGQVGTSMAESVVWVDGGGGLHLLDPGDARPERFLKMRLASRGLGDGNPQENEAMSIFFVGAVLRAAHASTRAALRGAPFGLYGAALGCPAEYCDDGRIKIFQRVAAQAWRWAHDPFAPTNLPDILVWMRDAAKTEAYNLFEARAEVAAAVDAFAMRRDTPEGRYAFLDIGAGTLDGACLKIFREPGKTGITVLSTSVAELGVEMIARITASGADVETRKRELFASRSFTEECWIRPRNEVSGFVGSLLHRARQLDKHADWLAPENGRPGAFFLPSQKARVARKLPVFFGGGGMKSRFYREAATRADNTNLTTQYGLPKLQLEELPAPEGFTAVPDAPFHRMAVAFGLTRPAREAPVLTLPQAVKSAPSVIGTARRRPPPVIDYGDTKDAYD